MKNLEKYKRIAQLVAGVAVVIIILATEVKAQSDAGFIYGKVVTIDNTFRGQIRWGKEEAFWNDHFNAMKLYKNDYQYVVTEKEKSGSSWSNFDWNLFSIWEDKRGGSVSHQFTCQFGDMRQMEITGESRVKLVLKNGVVLEVGGDGYNDIGTDVTVLDEELGEIKVKWNRLRKIEFMPTPDLRTNLGEPLYGTVHTIRKGEFSGFIQWDHDERLGTDKLDGSTSDGKVSIPFDQIRQITKYERGSKVVLKSGRELYVTGSNDVNAENRGVIISMEGVGKISVPWKAFQKVVFSDTKGSGAGYTQYRAPEGLHGKVQQYDGTTTSGRIIYDLDETWELEIIEGNDDEIGYEVPLRNIKRIAPKNYDYSTVELRNGDKLLLGGGRDVSERNAGLLIFENGGKSPVHIPWKNIAEITFD